MRPRSERKSTPATRILATAFQYRSRLREVLDLIDNQGEHLAQPTYEALIRESVRLASDLGNELFRLLQEGSRPIRFAGSCWDLDEELEESCD